MCVQYGKTEIGEEQATTSDKERAECKLRKSLGESAIKIQCLEGSSS